MRPAAAWSPAPSQGLPALRILLLPTASSRSFHLSPGKCQLQSWASVEAVSWPHPSDQRPFKDSVHAPTGSRGRKYEKPSTTAAHILLVLRSDPVGEPEARELPWGGFQGRDVLGELLWGGTLREALILGCLVALSKIPT